MAQENIELSLGNVYTALELVIEGELKKQPVTRNDIDREAGKQAFQFAHHAGYLDESNGSVQITETGRQQYMKEKKFYDACSEGHIGPW